MDKKILYFAIAVTIIVLILTGSYAAVHAYSLSKVELRGVEVVGAKDFDLEGYTIDVRLMLYNGGLVDVEFDRIDYFVILERGGYTLAEGAIEGQTIKKGEITVIEFSDDIEWQTTADIALGLLDVNATNAIVIGEVKLSDSISLKFEEKIDIEPYVRQYAQSQFNDLIDIGKKLLFN